MSKSSAAVVVLLILVVASTEGLRCYDAYMHDDHQQPTDTKVCDMDEDACEIFGPVNGAGLIVASSNIRR